MKGMQNLAGFVDRARRRNKRAIKRKDRNHMTMMV